MQVCSDTAPETKQNKVSTVVGKILKIANCCLHSTAQHHDDRSYAALFQILSFRQQLDHLRYCRKLDQQP